MSHKGSYMPKVLIIDDDPQLRTLLTKILTARDFEVTNAKDGVEGLDSAKANRPDLIMLDRDPWEEPASIKDMKILLTIFDGKIVYKRQSQPLKIIKEKI